jgi:hypothetical protein
MSIFSDSRILPSPSATNQDLARIFAALEGTDIIAINAKIKN